MMALLWRSLSVWIFVVAVCWHPSTYVCCSVPQQEVPGPLPTQKVVPGPLPTQQEVPGPLPTQGYRREDEEGQRTHKVDENRAAHAESVAESEQPGWGDGQLKEALETRTGEEAEQPGEASEAVLIEEAGEEPERAAPQPVTLPHDGSMAHDQKSGRHFETSATSSPPSSPTEIQVQSSPAASRDGDADGVKRRQHQQRARTSSAPSSLSVSPSDADEVPASEEHSVLDLSPGPCDSAESTPYDETSPPMVMENTSNAHTAGTKTHLDPTPSSEPIPGAQHVGANASHTLEGMGLSPQPAIEADSGGKDPEDNPTFDEWTRKMMELEKKQTQATHTTTNTGGHPVKKVQKNFNNYASVECGAKIIGANPEAKGTSAILKENMDLYMLNPCSNKIWVIIELCEPIQVKQLDIANFELFSSTPQDFVVSISNRFPTNKWLRLGTFHAREERAIQTFPLDEHLYAKYVKMFSKYLKVELVSHFGAEHFCPLSIIRVFGTSMVEEYEENAEPAERADDEDDDLDYPPGYVAGEAKSSRNLIGSAKDVILNMVNNIAVNVLGGGQGNISSQEVNATDLVANSEETTPSPFPGHDAEALESLSDSDINPEEDNSSSEAVTTETTTPELTPSEERIVTPLLDEEEEEEGEPPIGCTITLLDKEEDVEEEEELEKRERETTDHGAPRHHSRSSSLNSSSCSWAASVQEYLQQKCSGLLPERRTCQWGGREPGSSPLIQSTVPVWQLNLPTSACPAPPQTGVRSPEPQGEEGAPGRGEESGPGPAEVTEPLENVVETLKDSWLQPPLLLEPSQMSSSLLKPGISAPPAAQPTPPVGETAALAGTKKTREPAAGERWDVEVEEEAAEEEEEERKEPSSAVESSTLVSVTGHSGAPLVPSTEEPSQSESDQSDLDVAIQSPSADNQSEKARPSLTSQPAQEQAPPPVDAIDDVGDASPLAPPHAATDADSSLRLAVAATSRAEDILAEDTFFPASGGGGGGQPPRQGDGSQAHGSGQKESVFMRLSNRIKALETNMSLSGRYLEQLSQRYRKQMEEMQRAFNITIIKLQNTSRIAEEQEQRQTESIQSLGGQLENMTRLVLNLSVSVSQLQSEVSDRQSYLRLSLLLCLILGLVVLANHFTASSAPPSPVPEPHMPKSYSYCCPESQFTSCGDGDLGRRASYPLLHYPETLCTEETHSLSTDNRKNRGKLKPGDGAETPEAPTTPSAPEPADGAVVCNGQPRAGRHAALYSIETLCARYRDSRSEGSSEGSSHSDDPSLCGIAAACTRGICPGLPLPPPGTRPGKRAWRRRRSKPVCAVVDLLHAPRRDRSRPLPGSALQDLVRHKNERSSGTIGTKATRTGPA